MARSLKAMRLARRIDRRMDRIIRDVPLTDKSDHLVMVITKDTHARLTRLGALRDRVS